jgi:hypothetical protein
MRWEDRVWDKEVEARGRVKWRTRAKGRRNRNGGSGGRLGAGHQGALGIVLKN